MVREGAQGVRVADRHTPHPAPRERDASAHTTPPVPLHVVAGRLGDDPKTVLATYSHLLPHSDAMAAKAVAAAIFADKSLTNGAIPEFVPAN